MTEWTADRWKRIFDQLDHALALNGAERECWLANLEASDRGLGLELRALLGTHDANEAAAFLVSSPFAGNTSAPSGEAQSGGELHIIGKQFGPYRVLALLGQGGMGSVWLAERVDGLFRRQVALKLVHLSLTGRAVTERFNREREIVSGLSHPNIARLFDAGVSLDGQPYLALEYIEGRTLTTYCDEMRLAVRQRLEIFLQVLGAVQYAHAHLVIHRDLKPANILVTADGQVQLLDFGIAKLLTEGEPKETELTQRGGRALTPDYAAPEQIAGGPITIAADVYALGVMLYELLTGERPYRLKCDSHGALEEAILHADTILPSRLFFNNHCRQARVTTAKRLTNDLKGDLDTIVIKALKKSPVERYQTANAFAEDISRFLRGDVVLAQRDSFTYRTLKFVRRHQVGMAVAATLMLLLTGGLASMTYEARAVSKERDLAVAAQFRVLTLGAAARLKDADVNGALGVILEVLAHRGDNHPYPPEALSVFQEARAADAQVLALIGHQEGVRSAAFSADGTRIVTASFDRTARLWNAVSGREIMVFRHPDVVTCAALSPDGSQVATASHDKFARIWDVGTGRQVAVLKGHSDYVRSVAFSPDGRRLLTASYDKTARIWDVAAAREVMRLSGHAEALNGAAFSPDGRKLVTASQDKTARVWETATGREISALVGHTDRVRSAMFSPDGRRIVTASNDNTVRVWDADRGTQILVLSGHSDEVSFAAFSRDGRRIVSSSYDKTARLWDALTGREVMRLSGHTERLWFASFAPDGRRIVTASDDKIARLWDPVSERELVKLRGHANLVISGRFSLDGGRAITASYDKTARIWNAASGQEMIRLAGHAKRIWWTAFSRDGQRVVTASEDRTARIWDSTTGAELRRLIGHTDVVDSAEFSPDGQRVVTSSQDGTARLWDTATGQELRSFIGHDGPIWDSQFSPDGRRIVTASDDKTARIWDVEMGRQTLIFSGHTDHVISAEFSPNGTRLLTTSDDKTARIWDVDTGQEILRLVGHSGHLPRAVFSHDGRRIVTISDDKTARIWDANSGLQLGVFEHEDPVEGVDISNDGNKIITTSGNDARIWDTHLAPVERQISWVEAAQFDPLTATERSQLGLPDGPDMLTSTVNRTGCDDAAAAPYDPTRLAQGAMIEQIAADVADSVCNRSVQVNPNDARLHYQLGRSQLAGGHAVNAREEFERAINLQYPAAQVGLAILLSSPAAEMLDVPRAIELYEQAWHDGVTIAGYELGALFEHGLRLSDSTDGFVLAPDANRASIWYRKAADAGDPSALGRLGEKAEADATATPTAAVPEAQSMRAFKYFAAATEQARLENWPELASRDWRYRRASLARVLARQGHMQEVAIAYDDTRRQYARAPATIWGRLISLSLTSGQSLMN